MTREEVWLRAFCAYVPSFNATKEGATRCADHCLAAFDERFPAQTSHEIPNGEGAVNKPSKPPSVEDALQELDDAHATLHGAMALAFAESAVVIGETPKHPHPPRDDGKANNLPSSDR